MRKVPVVGITSLGLDHTQVLGETLAEIAEAKAGIMKRGCQAYTAPQPPEAMDVLVARAGHLNCSLRVVPQLSQYRFPERGEPRLPADVPTYRTNASLAAQLAHAWLRAAAGDCAPRLQLELPRATVAGLEQFRWPGRYHVVDQHYAKFYLDSACTKESMEICAQWFIDTSDSSAGKILIFSATGDRNAETLLQPLTTIPFKQIYFVVPTAHKVTSTNHDNYSLVEQEELIQRCQNHAQFWQRTNSRTRVTVLECVADALISVKAGGDKPSVLITGSLYLVGAALSILDPSLST